MIKRTKLLMIILNIVLLLNLIPSVVLGSGNLVTAFKGSITTTGTEELKTTGGEIVGIIQVVGTVVSVGMLSVIGIKYVLGSADQKAEYRKSMIPYFIGAVLIFGFSNITQVIYEWANSI